MQDRHDPPAGKRGEGLASIAVGVDGCRGGWGCAFRTDAGEPVFRVLQSFDMLLCMWPKATIAIDIPIGLPDLGARDCDVLARRLIGKRRASVFPAPLRRCLSAQSHSEASALRWVAEGKGMSIQTWGILSKIREVDAAMSPTLQRRVVECHPEVVFSAMNDGVSLSRNKKCAEGREQRRALLWRRLPDGEALFREPPGRGAEMDDLLDAAALLWSAERRLAGTARRLPDLPPVDERGLRMEIWY